MGRTGPTTWGRCQILIDDYPVTRLVDHRAKAYRDWVELSLYPLAEWIALNWWFLAAEIQTPGKHTEVDYAQRHSLELAGGGYALPALTLQPLGDYHQLTWTSIRLEHSGIEFIGEGVASSTLQVADNEPFNQPIVNLSTSRTAAGKVLEAPFGGRRWAAPRRIFRKVLRKAFAYTRIQPRFWRIGIRIKTIAEHVNTWCAA